MMNKLVVATSCSQGIEILPGIHEVAVQNVANCQGILPPNNLPLAPIDLTCGSASEVDISKVDVFCSSNPKFNKTKMGFRAQSCASFPPLAAHPRINDENEESDRNFSSKQG